MNTGYDPFQDATRRAMAQAIDLANEARGRRLVQCAGCGRQYPTVLEAADCAYRHAYPAGDGPWGRQRLSPAEARYLRLLEDNAGYCTDDEGDRVALARALAAMPAPITMADLERAIAEAIAASAAEMTARGFASVNPSSVGARMDMAHGIAPAVWAALRERGVLP